MESKIVSSALSKKLKSTLKQEGFTESSARKFWRHKSDRIEVVDFRSTGNNLFHLPPASFCVSMGIYFLEMPEQFELKVKNGKGLPEESECHFRYTLAKGIEQMFDGHRRNDVWFVANEDALEQCIDDCLERLSSDGLDFFKRFEDKEQVLYYLLNEEENFQGGSTGIFGNGPLGSPNRYFHTAYFALITGKHKTAISAFEKLLGNPQIYFHLQDRFRIDYQKTLNNGA